MKYERDSAYEVLEDVVQKLFSRVTAAERIINSTQSDINHMKVLISNINGFLDSQKCVAISPECCKHVHTKVTDDGKYETVTCAHCGLMLSYILL